MLLGGEQKQTDASSKLKGRGSTVDQGTAAGGSRWTCWPARGCSHRMAPGFSVKEEGNSATEERAVWRRQEEAVGCGQN